MYTTIPELETERLTLRGLKNSDLDVYAEMLADEEVVRFIGGKTMDRADAWRNMAMVNGHWTLHGFGFFALEEKATGKFVGRAGPWFPESWPQLEVGWTLSKHAWGKGYATEAAKASINWIFDQRPELAEIISVIHDDNIPSQNVAKRIGEDKTDRVFTYKGDDYPIWCVTRTAWEASKA